MRVELHSSLALPNTFVVASLLVLRHCTSLTMAFVALNGAACSSSKPAAPQVPTTSVFIMPQQPSPRAPIVAPWHNELARACATPSPVSRARITSVGDVDGDGRADILETTCAEHAAPDACAMRLCLSTAKGGHLMAAAWTAHVPNAVAALGNQATPRDFEAFELKLSTFGACLVGRRFHWGRGGYLGTTEYRCACKSATNEALEPGCARVVP